MEPTTGIADRSRGLLLLLALVCAPVLGGEESHDLHQQLKDPSPAVRLKAARKLAEANDAEAIPVLIDLLTELPAEERRSVEAFLTALAGEWAPSFPQAGEDEITRKLRRDIWRTWWRDTDGPALLRLVRRHALTPEVRQKVQNFVRQLGDDDFARREAAVKELHQIGRAALPTLRQARTSKDPELSRRARELVDTFEAKPAVRVPTAAVRLLALRKPQGAAEALLDYYPLVEDDDFRNEIRNALTRLAVQDGKLDAALMRALGDEMAERRIIAATALVKGGGRPGRAAAGRLFRDEDPLVRLPVALALASAGERDSVPVLIDLLAVLEGEPASQAEEPLFQLAGADAPKAPGGDEPAQRRQRRDAWAAWWKMQGNRADLGRLSDPPGYGYTLICDCAGGRVYEIDRRGQERWSIDKLEFPVDARILPGQRVLIAEHNGQRVSERHFKGQLLASRGLPSRPVNVQRLPNGHTFVVSPTGWIWELDRKGLTDSAFQLPGCRAGQRTRQGTIYALFDKECVMMDTAGKRKKRFDVDLPIVNPGCLDVLPNGHVLIASAPANKVVEFDTDGKIIREVKAPGVTTATVLPNGHILAASRTTQRVFELDRSGKVVWEHSNAGKAYRARRR